MQDNIFISYNWVFVYYVVNTDKQSIVDYEIKSIGSTYEEAKDIAIHLLKRKGLRSVRIIHAISTGIRFAYLQDEKTNIPVSEYPDLPVASIPEHL